MWEFSQCRSFLRCGSFLTSCSNFPNGLCSLLQHPNHLWDNPVWERKYLNFSSFILSNVNGVLEAALKFMRRFWQKDSTCVRFQFGEQKCFLSQGSFLGPSTLSHYLGATGQLNTLLMLKFRFCTKKPCRWWCYATLFLFRDLSCASTHGNPSHAN